jgi:type I restriction enzyme M protein
MIVSVETAEILTTSNGNFFSSGLRNKVDQLMDTLWAGGVNNPMDSIEQISYLLFLRLLSERDEQNAAIQPSYEPIFSGEWSRYSWGNFVTLTGDELFDTLRSALERLYTLPRLTPTGQMLFRGATLKIYDRPTLRAVVQQLDRIDLTSHDGHDLKGDMYEYLLSKLAQSGTNGQFRTPRHIIDLIVKLVDPQPSQRICDPACGTAGFLIAAYAHILRRHARPARPRGAARSGDPDDVHRRDADGGHQPGGAAPLSAAGTDHADRCPRADGADGAEPQCADHPQRRDAGDAGDRGGADAGDLERRR